MRNPTKRGWRITAVAWTVLALAAAPALAQRPGGRAGGPGAGGPPAHGGFGGGPGAPHHRHEPAGAPGHAGPGMEAIRLILHRLDLDAGQRQAIHDVLEERRAEVDPETVRAHREARDAMVRLLWSPDATPADVDAQAAVLAGFDRARAAHRFETTRLVLAALTPEQVEELQELLEDPPPPPRRSGAGNRPGRRGPSGS